MHKVIEEIYAENSWRDGEFAKFKKLPQSVEDKLWGRMCIPMIYANWEGFVVSSLKVLLKHLNELKLSALQIPTKLIVIGLGDSYRTLSGKQSFDQRCDFTSKFNDLLKNTIRFKTKIETKSNLNSAVLYELCNMFSFDFNKFKAINPELDRLVHIRNSIAHGENSFLPNKENLELYIESVQRGIDILINEINDFLINESYLLKC